MHVGKLEYNESNAVSPNNSSCLSQSTLTESNLSLHNKSSSFFDVSVDLENEKSKTVLPRSTIMISMQAIIYGCIIALVCCPLMIGYCTIIYSDPIFQPFLPKLIKLVFVSTIIHQLCVSYRSPLKFGIGVTQDAGLIFLSTMATSIVHELGDDVPNDEKMATVLVHLSLSTALVGISLIITGKLQLASLVQYLPMPVVGGYLAFIGLFTLQAGLNLMTGFHLTSISSWGEFCNLESITLLLPGIFGAIILVFIANYSSHFSVFPAFLVVMPTVFYATMWFGGLSFEDVRQDGWVGEKTAEFSFYEIWNLFDFSKVHWAVMLTQLPTWTGMFLVIAFSSSLDIAAIIMGTSNPMDYNEQLQTLGYSNFASGCLGGYTGSYSFSQTLFAFSTNTNSRLIGLTVVAVDVFILVVPYSLTSIIPKFFFGSVMVFLGFEIMSTWIIRVYKKVLLREYLLLLLSFLLVNWFGAINGMAFGIILAAFLFLYEYSRVPNAEEVVKVSNVTRNLEVRDMLAPIHTRIVTVELHGWLFFGSSTKVLDYVKESVVVHNSLPFCAAADEQSIVVVPFDGTPLLSSTSIAAHGVSDLATLGQRRQRREKTEFLILDFSNVSGLDATAARSCFLSLKLYLKEHQITIVYTQLSTQVEYLLRANDVIVADDKNCKVFTELDESLDYCEECLIKTSMRANNIVRGPSFFEHEQTQLLDVLQAYLHLPKHVTTLKPIEKYFEKQYFEHNQNLFHLDDPSDAIYVLLSGEVTLYTCTEKHHGNGGTPHHREKHAKEYELLRRVQKGVIIGDLDYFMEQPRTIQAVVSSTDGSRISYISRKAMNQMEQTEPHLALRFQQVVLKGALMTTGDTIHSVTV